MSDSLFRIIFLLALIFSGTAMAIEEPRYSVIENAPPFELRAYDPMIVAEVQVDGDLDEASRQGFQLIAAYIFGKNQVNESMGISASVTIEERLSKGVKIAMTAPVIVESSAERWTVSFVMPAEHTLATLPRPLDSRVRLRAVPAEKKAVIRFTGFYNSQKVAEKTLELEQWIRDNNLRAIGDPKFARYDPPWTLPFLRRNEILLNVH
ncbi:heme-binding protein [Polynucleobacter sp. MWH-UH23A]|uniref:SOUL family heme-binding protein n=1 Tax=Polynucleobacter sp. MWH-UH23A TaxID=1855613 RepID=UPI003364FE02